MYHELRKRGASPDEASRSISEGGDIRESRKPGCLVRVRFARVRTLIRHSGYEWLLQHPWPGERSRNRRLRTSLRSCATTQPGRA